MVFIVTLCHRYDSYMVLWLKILYYCMILMLKRSYRRNSMIRSPCSIRTPAHSFKNMKHNTVKMTRHSRPQWGGDSWMLIPHFGWSNLFLGKVKLFGNCTNTKWNSHNAEFQVWSNNNSHKLFIGGCSSEGRSANPPLIWKLLLRCLAAAVCILKYRQERYWTPLWMLHRKAHWHWKKVSGNEENCITCSEYKKCFLYQSIYHCNGLHGHLIVRWLGSPQV